MSGALPMSMTMTMTMTLTQCIYYRAVYLSLYKYNQPSSHRNDHNGNPGSHGFLLTSLINGQKSLE